MNLKQAIKAKLSTKGFRVFKPDQVVSVPLLLEIIELLEKDNDAKIKVLKKEIEELKKDLETKSVDLQTELAFVRSCVLEDTDYY